MMRAAAHLPGSFPAEQQANGPGEYHAAARRYKDRGRAVSIVDISKRKEFVNGRRRVEDTMRRADAWIGWWVLVFLVSIGTARAEDPRLSLFERYNRASTGDEVKPLVSGTLARQYGVLASKEEELRRVLKAQQFASYRARVVELDDKTTFLVVEDGRSASGGRAEAQAYLLSKGAGGVGTLPERFLAPSVIRTLWGARLAPAQCDHAAQCSTDGQRVGPRCGPAGRRQGDIR